MKRFFLASLSLISVFNLSCNKDTASTDPNVQLFSIEGNWIRFKIDEVVDNQEVFTDYQHVVGCPQDYMSISQDETGSDIFFVKNGSNCLPGTHPLSWTRNGNSISFSFLGDNWVGELITMGTELKVKLSNGVIIIYKKV
jgi:hypothetical protein